MPSFFSERTAEYAILPPLISYLQQRFGAAVPMYFWATREGNRTAQERHVSQRFRVLVVFARRPKVLDEQHVLGKINKELFEFADRAVHHGLPTVAAFPGVGDIFELGRNFQTYWFPLAGFTHRDIHFKLHLPTSDIFQGNECQLPSWTLEEVGEVVEKASLLIWRNAIQAIQKIRHVQRVTPSYGFFGGGSNYQPVYILIPG